jgi:hypothetical protein
MELGKSAGKIILLLDDDRAGLSAAVRICTKVRCITVQYGTGLKSTLEYNTVQCGTGQCRN